MPHRRELQGLRAVAVLLVVLDHGGVPFLQGGYVGVDVFFVLSGYLITGLLLREAGRDGRIRLSDFYVRRARRILPAAVLDARRHRRRRAPPAEPRARARGRRATASGRRSSWRTCTSPSAGSDYFAQGQPPSPVQHFWTLAVEEQFYLVWPVVLAGVLGRGVSAAATALARARCGGRLARVVDPQHGDRCDLRVLLDGHARLGARARRGAGDRRRRGCAGRQRGLASACICIAAVAFSSSTPFPGYAALLPTIGAALVIAAAPGSGSRLLSLAPFRYVGDRSYAFYLWHWPVLVIAAEYVGHDLSTAVRLGLLAGAFGLSILSYASSRTRSGR